MYTVSTGNQQNFSFYENDTVKSVLQNVLIILKTPKGSVPMYRDFGLDMSFIDKPGDAAEALLFQNAVDAVETFEPRAEVLDTALTCSADGKAVVTLTLEVKA